MNSQGILLNDYEFSTPRGALGMVALAMTALTVGTLVALPATLDSGRAEPRASGAAMGAADAPAGIALDPARTGAPGVAELELYLRHGRAILEAQAMREKRHQRSLRARTQV